MGNCSGLNCQGHAMPLLHSVEMDQVYLKEESVLVLLLTHNPKKDFIKSRAS